MKTASSQSDPEIRPSRLRMEMERRRFKKISAKAERMVQTIRDFQQKEKSK